MMNKLAYSTLALTLSFATVSACQAEAAGTDYAAAFKQIRQIDAGDLNIGYVDIGPKNGEPVILLHGWPYDIQSYAQVAPALAAKVPGDCAVQPWVWYHAFSVGIHAT